jgi:hypothetical protein
MHTHTPKIWRLFLVFSLWELGITPGLLLKWRCATRSSPRPGKIHRLVRVAWKLPKLRCGVAEQARSSGAESARRQLGYYGLQAKEIKPEPEITNTVYEVIDAKAKEQETAVVALLLGEADEGLILGDQERQGIIRPYDVITTSAFWIAWMFWEGFSDQAGRSNKAGEFSKQVVAALDHRTTDCCLQAHGQVVAFQGKFKLTGTPRFADELEWTPFHHYCRTSIVLYLPGYDDGLTERMKQDARKVLGERAQGVNKYRHPACAFIV